MTWNNTRPFHAMLSILLIWERLLCTVSSFDSLTSISFAVVFVNTQIIEAIYSSYPLKIFLPYFPGAQLETRLIVKDVYAEKEEALKFSSIYEIRRFHPASCLVMTLKVGEWNPQTMPGNGTGRSRSYSVKCRCHWLKKKEAAKKLFRQMKTHNGKKASNDSSRWILLDRWTRLPERSAGKDGILFKSRVFQFPRPPDSHYFRDSPLHRSNRSLQILLRSLR